MLGHFIKKILISSLVLSSTTAWSKSLSQLEEKALGEYIYRMEGPQKFSLIEFENYFLYELNRICDLSDVHLDHPLTLRIIDSNTVNAFATSGSFVFIYTGIIKQLTDVSEIMGVLCHELTHTKEHHTRRTVESRSDSNNQKMLLLATFPMVLLLPGIGELLYAMAVDQTFIQQQLFSQQMEYEADAGALELMRNAGFDGSKLISAFESLGRYQGNSMIPDHFSYYATHPLTSDRIARVKNALQTHPQFVLAIDRAQLDYTLLLSRLYQPYEKIPSTHDNYATLIETYRAGIADKDISGLLKTYPHSVMLRLDRLEQLLYAEQWKEAGEFNQKQEEHDPYWARLPIVQSAVATIDSHQLSQKEFIRKYQGSLLTHNVNYEMLKYLAECYVSQNMHDLYHITQAKYFLECGAYDEALSQLKHPSVNQHSIYAQAIKNDAELMISVNRRLRSL